MTKTKPQILTVKSTLSDITVWRTCSLPLLDGGQGEHTKSPVTASHFVRFDPPDPNSHHQTPPPLPEGQLRSGPPLASAVTPSVTSTTSVPPVIVDHGTSPDWNRLPLATVDHGTSPDGNRLPLETAPLVTVTSSMPPLGTYPNGNNSPREMRDDLCTSPIGDGVPGNPQDLELSHNTLDWPKPQHTTVDITGTTADHGNLKQTWLCPPRMNDNTMVTGTSTPRHRIENKQRRKSHQAAQHDLAWWSTHTGDFHLPLNTDPAPPCHHNKQMWPQGLANKHPAGDLLLRYATEGCPVLTGAPWTPAQMQAAVERGPHESAMLPEAMEQLRVEVLEKVKQGQARLVEWEDI
jgi:hypothetical protein